MLTKLSLALVFCFGVLVQNSTAQEPREVRLRCVFEEFPIYSFVQYACILRNINFDFSNPFYYITIEGEHMTGRTNADVLNLVIQTSDINVIPANIFQVFPNIQYIEAFRSGIVSMGGTSFTFAARVRGLFVNFNAVPALTGAPFFGRSGVTHLNLYSNQIESISENFFMSLSGLRYLSLGGNNLRSNPPRLFAPLVNLRHFLASSNQLESLSRQTFATNRQVEIIALESNKLSSLAENLFNGLDNLEYIGLTGNTCVDSYFEFDGGVDIDDVNNVLQACFDNFVPEPPRRRTLLFELRGNMTFFDEYNRQILNVTGRTD